MLLRRFVESSAALSGGNMSAACSVLCHTLEVSACDSTCLPNPSAELDDKQVLLH